MEQQKIFRKSFIDDLQLKLETDNGVNLFRNSEFQFNDTDILFYPHIKKPLNLLNSLDHQDDLSSAIKLFEAFESISPVEASDSRLWNYLSLVDLYPYVRERWPNVYRRVSSTNEKTYIQDHFILNKSSELLRCWLSGLWWSVFLSIDSTDVANKYKLTKVLFWNQTLRTRTLGTYLLARNKNILLGFLDYCFMKGKSHFNNFEDEHQEITKYLNKLGGAKNLSYFERQEIIEILKSKFG